MKKLLTILTLSLLLTGCATDEEKILGGIDSSVVAIDKISTLKGELKVDNTDDNTNETFIIKSDKKVYSGTGDIDVILSVTNLRDDEWGSLKLKFSEDEYINSISKYVPVEDTIDTPVISKIEINCPAKASTTTCYETTQSTTTQTVIRDTWESVKTTSLTPQISLLQKQTKGDYDSKEARYLFPKGTTFFKVNIKFVSRINYKDEFFIEVFGDKGGYGMLDPLIDDIIGYWKLDEASGNAADATGNGYTGTNSNVTFTGGKINNCGVFNGSSAKFTITDATALKPTTAFTISAWIYNDNTDASKGIFNSFNNTTNKGIYFYKVSTNKLRLLIDGQNFDSSASIGTGAWIHVVAVYTGARVYLYINNSQQDMGAWSTNPTYPATNYVKIGCLGDSTDAHYWDGNIDEVGFWSRALSQTEIGQLYNSGAGFQYPFSTSSTTTVLEESDIIFID